MLFCILATIFPSFLISRVSSNFDFLYTDTHKHTYSHSRQRNATKRRTTTLTLSLALHIHTIYSHNVPHTILIHSSSCLKVCLLSFVRSFVRSIVLFLFQFHSFLSSLCSTSRHPFHSCTLHNKNKASKQEK